MRRVFRIPFSRFRLVREVDDEILFHLQSRIDALVAEGMSPEEARASALKQFGDVRGVRGDMLVLDRERETAARRRRFIAEIRQDVAYGVRTLRRNAALAATRDRRARPRHRRERGDLFARRCRSRSHASRQPSGSVWSSSATRDTSTRAATAHPTVVLYSYPLYLDVRKNANGFDGLAAVGASDRVDAYFGESATELEHPHGRLVSGNYFAVLGVHAAAGRTLDASADEPSAPGGGDDQPRILGAPFPPGSVRGRASRAHRRHSRDDQRRCPARVQRRNRGGENGHLAARRAPRPPASRTTPGSTIAA